MTSSRTIIFLLSSSKETLISSISLALSKYFSLHYNTSSFNLEFLGVDNCTWSSAYSSEILLLIYLYSLLSYSNDPETKAVVLIGEIGGDAEEQAAQYIKDNMTKPVVAFIAGQSAPPGKRMGHAGAIISSGAGTAEEKIKAFAAAGVPVAAEPGDIPGLVKEKLGL